MSLGPGSGSFRSDRLELVVKSVLTARRELWKLTVENEQPISDGFLPLSSTEIARWERNFLEALPSGVANKLMFRREGRELISGEGETTRARIQLLETHVLLRALFRRRPVGFKRLPPAKLRSDCAYFVWRELREFHKAQHHQDVLLGFQEICERLNSSPGTDRQDLRRIAKALATEPWLDLFVETCLSLEEIDHGLPLPGLSFRREWRDAAFLMTRLFGFRTSIPGFDTILEGGLSLAESSPGRVIVVFGPFGSGKSILTLSLASEVVRKGGAATVIPLDDTAETLDAYVVTFGLHHGLELAHRVSAHAGESSESATGLKIRYHSLVKGGIEELSQAIGYYLEPIGASQPRLIVVNPINSILDIARAPARARQALNEMVAQVREAGANLILVAERSDRNSRPWLDELPYIADTVIELSTRHTHGYDQRYLQVSKSRFQQERRGLHPIAIVPSRGIDTSHRGIIIAPSSPAVLSDIRRPYFDTRPPPILEPIEFGWQEFNDLVGEIHHGDTLAFRGPEGSLKTVVGHRFLARTTPLAPAGYLERRSLFLTDRSNRPLHAYYEAQALLTGRERDSVDFMSFPSGYVQPGRLLMNLMEEFARARDRGVLYDRVIASNAGRWDLTCPFVRDDPGFGEALLEVFHREGASVIFICAEREAEHESRLQRLLVDRVTVLVDFERIEHRGVQRVLCRVARTNSAPGSQDWHEIRSHGGKLRLAPSLLRIQQRSETNSVPEVYEVKTTLHLFTTEKDRDPYMVKTEERLNSVLMTPVKVLKLDQTMLTGAVRLGSLSGASDLHIVQVDEYQLPAFKESGLLHPFRTSHWDIRTRETERPAWEELDVELKERISLDHSMRHLVAVPYYNNIALLTLQPEDAATASTGKPDDGNAPISWDALRVTADEVSTWEKLKGVVTTKSRGIWFDFDGRMDAVGSGTDENLNCLFLEILLGYLPAFPPARRGFDGLEHWMRDPLFREALACFHALSHREPQGATRIARQWYVTLPTLKGRYRVASLPGSVAVSGEWYLGVRAHCAVPDVGLRIILDELTSREAESARLSTGHHVGLPMTRAFYDDTRHFFHDDATVDESVKLWSLLTGASRRSEIYCYPQLQPILFEYLGALRRMREADTAVLQGLVERLVARTRTVLAPNTRPPRAS